MKDMIEKIKTTEKKKLIIVVVFFVAIMVILLGGALLYNKFFYKRSYSEVENIMLKIAKAHMEKNKSKLPKNINEVVTLSVADLVRNKEMKDISEYLKDDSISCKGTIKITNINMTYRYTPDLDCGNAYKTKKFIDVIKDNNPIVEDGNGLYNMNEQLVYRGDNVNNYLKLSDKLYRIVKFVGDEAVIIYSDKEYKSSWDDRYNIDRKSTVGINDYSVSRIKEYVDSLYQGRDILKIDKDGFDSKQLVVAYPLEIGKRDGKNIDNSGNMEKSAVIENQFIGLLPVYDYLNASLDKNCSIVNSESCMNYNYFSQFEYSWWTATASSLDSFRVYYIFNNLSASFANRTVQVRYVLHLAKDALYVSGNGTLQHPYIVK